VADTAGRTIAVFPDAGPFAWNANGTLLALMYSHEDTRTEPREETVATADSLIVWQRSTGRTRRFSVKPTTFEWARDTLFLGYPGRVEAISPMTGTVTPTAHRWAMVSPDGMYSLIRDEVRAEGFRCIEENTEIEVSSCALDQLRVGTTYVPESFWISGPDFAHALCVSACADHYSAPGQSNCKSAIVDARSLDVLQSLPGKVVATTSDGTQLVMLRGDSLALVALALMQPAKHGGPLLRVKLELEAWGGGEVYVGEPARKPQRLTWYYDVREGDWLPSHTHFWACDKIFHVQRVLGPDSISVQFPEGYFTEKTGQVVISRTPTSLRTASMDGGYIITLSVAPR
jgi:hypothetical protein